MSNPEWGKKRTCTHCGARFYDLRRNPAVCPKCDTVISSEKKVKTKRPAKPVEEVKKPAPAPVAESEDKELDDILGDEEDIEDADEDEGVMEDTADLGEDDMSEIVGNIDGKEEESG